MRDESYFVGINAVMMVISLSEAATSESIVFKILLLLPAAISASALHHYLTTKES